MNSLLQTHNIGDLHRLLYLDQQCSHKSDFIILELHVVFDRSVFAGFAWEATYAITQMCYQASVSNVPSKIISFDFSMIYSLLSLTRFDSVAPSRQGPTHALQKQSRSISTDKRNGNSLALPVDPICTDKNGERVCAGTG